MFCDRPKALSVLYLDRHASVLFVCRCRESERESETEGGKEQLVVPIAPQGLAGVRGEGGGVARRQLAGGVSERGDGSG